MQFYSARSFSTFNRNFKACFFSNYRKWSWNSCCWFRENRFLNFANIYGERFLVLMLMRIKVAEFYLNRNRTKIIVLFLIVSVKNPKDVENQILSGIE